MDGTSVDGISNYVKPLDVIKRAISFNDIKKVSKKKYKKIKETEDLSVITEILNDPELIYPVIVTDGVNNLLIDEEE